MHIPLLCDVGPLMTVQLVHDPVGYKCMRQLRFVWVADASDMAPGDPCV